MREIPRYVTQTPPGWITWPLPDEEVTRELVELVDGPEVLANARRCYGALAEGFVELEGVAGASVWFPDRLTGEACGTMTSGVITCEGVDAAGYLERYARRPRGRGLRVLEYEASIGELDAGPVVAEIEVSVRRPSREVMSYAHVTIFPPGYGEAVYFRFATPMPAMFDALITEGQKMTEALEICGEGD